jgi:hypothetical protein
MTAKREGRRTLEEQPLLSKVVLGGTRRKADLQILVVLLNQVLDDGAALPEGKAGVGILDSWHAAIGVDGEVLGLLERGEGLRDDLVGDVEFAADDGDFGGIGAAFAVDFDGLNAGHRGFGLWSRWLLGFVEA